MPTAKRPCCICHRWFRPDNRVGSRQRACSNPDCGSVRRRKKQAAWRRQNPDYFAGHRIQVRKVAAEPREPLRLSPPLNRLPWDIAQSEFGVQGADFIGIMGTLLLRSAQSQFAAYGVDSRADTATLPPLAVQSQMQLDAELSSRGGQVCDASGISSTGASS